MDTVLGTKKQIGQKFLDDGTRIPVTEIVVPAMAIVQKKTVETDGYSAIQLGFGTRKRAHKSQAGHAKKANLDSVPRVLREVRVEADFSLDANSISVTDVLKVGDIVSVSGISKGKGWAGGVKRYGFNGGPRTHGQSDRERAPGSIGQTTTPGRVYKGKHMAGRMGSEKVTVRNLIVMDITGDTILVAGLVPGIKNSLLTIRKIGEVPEKKFVPIHRIAAQEDVISEEPKVTTESETSAESGGTKVESTDTHEDTMQEEAAVAEAPDETVADDSAPEETPKEGETA